MPDQEKVPQSFAGIETLQQLQLSDFLDFRTMGFLQDVDHAAQQIKEIVVSDLFREVANRVSAVINNRLKLLIEENKLEMPYGEVLPSQPVKDLLINFLKKIKPEKLYFYSLAMIFVYKKYLQNRLNTQDFLLYVCAVENQEEIFGVSVDGFWNPEDPVVALAQSFMLQTKSLIDKEILKVLHEYAASEKTGTSYPTISESQIDTTVDRFVSYDQPRKRDVNSLGERGNVGEEDNQQQTPNRLDLYMELQVPTLLAHAKRRGLDFTGKEVKEKLEKNIWDQLFLIFVDLMKMKGETIFLQSTLKLI